MVNFMRDDFESRLSMRQSQSLGQTSERWLRMDWRELTSAFPPDRLQIGTRFQEVLGCLHQPRTTMHDFANPKAAKAEEQKQDGGAEPEVALANPFRISGDLAGCGLNVCWILKCEVSQCRTLVGAAFDQCDQGQEKEEERGAASRKGKLHEEKQKLQCESRSVQ